MDAQFEISEAGAIIFGMGKLILACLMIHTAFFQSASELIGNLGSDDPDVREEATEKLIALWESPDVLEMLRPEIESSNPEIAKRAAYISGRISLRKQLGKECVTELGEVREMELFESTEESALNLFNLYASFFPGYRIQCGSQRVLIYLANKAASSEQKIKLLNLISAHRTPEVESKVKELLNDPIESVSVAAIHCAGEMKFRNLTAEILLKTRSKSELVRKTAAALANELAGLRIYIPNLRVICAQFFRNL